MQSILSRLKNKTEFLQAIAVGNQGLLSIIGLARTIIIVRLLTPADYGVIGIALAVGGVFSIFQNLGLGVGVAKEAAQNPDPARLGMVTLLILGVRYIMLLPLLAILVFVVSPEANQLYKIPDIEYLIDLYALFILVSSPGDILGYVLTGAGRFKSFFLLKFINEILLTIVVSSMIWQLGIPGYFIGQIIVGAFYSIISFALVWKYIGGKIEKISWDECRELLRSVFKTSLSAYVAKLCRSFSLQIPVLIAGVVLPIAAVGWLKFGMQAGGYVATVIAAAQVVTLPRMVGYLKTHGQDFLFDKFATNFRRLTYALGFILIGAVMFAPEGIKIIAGNEFISSVKAFQFVVLYYIIVVSADTIFSGIYFPLNREYDYVKSYVIYFLVAAGLAYFPIAYFKTPESSLYGMLVGACCHILIALLFLADFKKLRQDLTATVAKLALMLLLAFAIIAADMPLPRLIIGFLSLFLIAAYASRSEPGLLLQVTDAMKKRITK